MSFYAHTEYDHNLLAEVVRDFGSLPEVKESPYLLEDMQWKINNWRQGIYKLVVVGEINTGKSSFVNALLENPALAPVAARVASAVPIKIIYGKKIRFRVHFLTDQLDDPELKTEPLEIKPEELEQYATESGTGAFTFNQEVGNRNNKLDVDYISIEYPNPLLKEGLVVVDLPGLGGVYKHHTRLVHEYLHPRRADHVIFVLDSTGNPLSKEEAEAIRGLKEKKMDRFIFIQTKIDSPGEELVERYKTENLRQISEILDMPVEEIAYFTVSNTLKLEWLESDDVDDFNDSGFRELQAYLLETVVPEKKDALAEIFAIDLVDRIEQIGRSLREQYEIYSADTKQRLEELKAKVLRHRQEMENWNSVHFPAIKQTLAESLNEAKISSYQKLRRELDFMDIVEPELDALEERNPTAEQVVEEAGKLFERVKDRAIAVAYNISSDYQNNCESSLLDASEKLKASIPIGNLPITAATGQNLEMKEIHLKSRFAEKMSRTWGGGAVGMVVAAKLLIIAAPVLALPAIAIKFGGLISGLFFGNKARSEHKQQMAEKAISQLKSKVSSGFRKLHTDIMLEAENSYNSVNKEIITRFSEAVISKKQMLSANQYAIKDNEQKSKTEVENTKIDLRTRIRSVDVISDRLAEAMNS